MKITRQEKAVLRVSLILRELQSSCRGNFGFDAS